MCPAAAQVSLSLPPFTATHTPRQLLEIVRAVSLHADADAPTSVTTRAWNEHRAPAGFPDAPQAFSMTKRLGVSWAQLLRAAHAPPDDALRQLRNFQADKGRKGLTLAGVFIALRQAAHRLGQTSVNRTDYVRARDLILAPSARTRHAATAARAIPALTAIDDLLKRHGLSWEQGLERAGLEPPERIVRSGLSLEEAVRAFVEDTGRLPRSRRQIFDWADHRGVALRRIDRFTEEFQRATTTVLAQRELDGLPPVEVADAGLRFESAADGSIGPQKVRHRWTRETLIAGMALAIRELGPGRQLDQRSLKQIAADRRDLPIPSYSVVYRHLQKHPDDTWDQWRREAEALSRASA